MKKRILALATVLALAAVLVVPMAALADGTTDVGGTLDVPTVISINPNSGVQGNTYTLVAIVGTYLTGATAVTFTGTGVTGSTISVTDDSHITCTITITAGATADARDVSVTTPGGIGTLTGGFTVVASSFSVTAPAGFSLGIMTRATNTAQGPDGTVSTTAQNWQVTATGSTSLTVAICTTALLPQRQSSR